MYGAYGVYLVGFGSWEFVSLVGAKSSKSGMGYKKNKC